MSKNEESNVLVSILAGIGLGAIIGAAAGLLFAPKPGTEMREDVLKAAEELKNKAEGVIGELGTSVDELVSKSKDLVETTKTRVQAAIESGKQSIAESRIEVEEEIEQAEEA